MENQITLLGSNSGGGGDGDGDGGRAGVIRSSVFYNSIYKMFHAY